MTFEYNWNRSETKTRTIKTTDLFDVALAYQKLQAKLQASIICVVFHGRNWQSLGSHASGLPADFPLEA